MPTDEKKKIPVETGGHPDTPILPQTDDRGSGWLSSPLHLPCLWQAACICSSLPFLGFGEPGGGLKIEHIRPLDIKPEKNTTIHFKDYYDYGHSENQDTVRLVC